MALHRQPLTWAAFLNDTLPTRTSLKKCALSGAIWFTLVMVPVSFFLLSYGFSYDPNPRQQLAMGILAVLSFPSILVLGPLEDLGIIADDLLIVMAFPLNGAFWGCVYWYWLRYRHHLRQKRP
jgi:hypothetical protein